MLFIKYDTCSVGQVKFQLQNVGTTTKLEFPLDSGRLEKNRAGYGVYIIFNTYAPGLFQRLGRTPQRSRTLL